MQIHQNSIEIRPYRDIYRLGPGLLSSCEVQFLVDGQWASGQSDMTLAKFADVSLSLSSSLFRLTFQLRYILGKSSKYWTPKHQTSPGISQITF